MALVKLEIDGRRVTADANQTILEAARQHGILTIPTLCHDQQLEPFASCFVCVVKVKGARSLLPACSTKVSNGMVSVMPPSYAIVPLLPVKVTLM